MQLELPFLIESEGHGDRKHPTRPPPGRLRQIRLGGRVIAYWLRRANRQTIGISIDEHGLTGSAPRWAAIADVEGFIREKERWVLKRLDELRRQARSPFAWREGSELPYLGRSIALARSAWGRARLAGDRLHLPTMAFESPPRLRDSVVGWLKTSALALHRERVVTFASSMDVALPEVGLSNAMSQWGSCSKAVDGRGRVLLHWKLVHFERRLIDYVVVHELAHLKHMNHSAAFWRVVERTYPEHKWARRELRERGHLIPDL
jgi:predicted metal-dependent hydrolase